jgi:hypothetical protein
METPGQISAEFDKRLIYRAASLASIEQMRGGLDITFPTAERRVHDRASALPNADLKEAQDP